MITEFFAIFGAISFGLASWAFLNIAFVPEYRAVAISILRPSTYTFEEFMRNMERACSRFTNSSFTAHIVEGPPAQIVFTVNLDQNLNENTAETKKSD